MSGLIQSTSSVVFVGTLPLALIADKECLSRGVAMMTTVKGLPPMVAKTLRRSPFKAQPASEPSRTADGPKIF